MHLYTSSVEAKFGSSFIFHTTELPAEGRAARRVENKKGLLMSNQMNDDTFGPEREQILR